MSLFISLGPIVFLVTNLGEQNRPGGEKWPSMGDRVNTKHHVHQKKKKTLCLEGFSDSLFLIPSLDFRCVSLSMLSFLCLTLQSYFYFFGPFIWQNSQDSVFLPLSIRPHALLAFLDFDLLKMPLGEDNAFTSAHSLPGLASDSSNV